MVPCITIIDPTTRDDPTTEQARACLLYTSLGCIVGLEALKRPCTVTVYSDSQYLVNAFNQNWVAGWLKRGWKNSQKQPVKNVDLWKRLLAAKEPHTVKFVWVKGHAGHPENERCDELATTAADNPA